MLKAQSFAAVLCLCTSVASLPADEAELTESDVAQIFGRIEYVLRGGWWSREGAHGSYRLVVSRYDWAEYQSHRVFLQWVRLDTEHGREVVEHTSPIPEVDGYYLFDPPRALRLDPMFDSRTAFEVIGWPRGVDEERLFTITPWPDHQYSIDSRRIDSELRKMVPVTIAAGAGFLAGSLLTLIIRRRRS